MALRARKVSGAFEKWAPGLTTHCSFFVEVVEVSLGVGWWGWVLVNFFYLQGGRLFEVGAYSRLGT